jgi:hypothetical protein
MNKLKTQLYIIALSILLSASCPEFFAKKLPPLEKFKIIYINLLKDKILSQEDIRKYIESTNFDPYSLPKVIIYDADNTVTYERYNQFLSSLNNQTHSAEDYKDILREILSPDSTQNTPPPQPPITTQASSLDVSSVFQPPSKLIKIRGFSNYEFEVLSTIVTTKQYHDVTGSTDLISYPDSPTIQSWSGAVFFCFQLNKKLGLEPYDTLGGNGFRLPSEGELKYLASLNYAKIIFGEINEHNEWVYDIAKASTINSSNYVTKDPDPPNYHYFRIARTTKESSTKPQQPQQQTTTDHSITTIQDHDDATAMDDLARTLGLL